MFTGIIQGQGEVRSLRRTGGECRICLRPLFTPVSYTHLDVYKRQHLHS